MNLLIRHKVFLVAILSSCIPSLLQALDNGLAQTPPMGWLAWERFTCETDCNKWPDDCIGSKLFKTMANRLLFDDFLKAGYQYVNIDDCWSKRVRNNISQKLESDSQRFPGGIEELAAFMHSRGLKLGIYGDCGLLTCAGYPGQLKSLDNLEDNYFQVDAETLADWQVDSFKFDGCFIDPFDAESICPKMTDQLVAKRRPILLVCEWPFYMLRFNVSTPVDWPLAQRSCNVWRYYEDIEDSWQSILNVIDFTTDMQNTIVQYHGPGHWFDPDQLVIGNFGLSYEQARAQMAIWSIWSAPLYMSNDLRKLAPEMGEILKNKQLIEVDQDALGIFGLLVRKLDEVEAYVKPVEPITNGCPSFVIAYLNRNVLGNIRLASFSLKELLKGVCKAIEIALDRYSALYSDRKDAFKCKRRLEDQDVVYKVKELFENKFMGEVGTNDTLDLLVAPSGVAIVKLVEI